MKKFYFSLTFIFSIVLLFTQCTNIERYDLSNDCELCGSYKQTSGAHYEIFLLKDDSTLTSEYSTRLHNWKKYNENGTWNLSGDTLTIIRDRDPELALWQYPGSNKYIVKGNKLFELKYNYNKELFRTSYFFERQ